MSKRKAATAELTTADGAAAAPSPSPSASGRSRRNNVLASDSPSPFTVAAADSSAAAASAAASASPAAVPADEDMSDKPAVRRGGRQAVVSEVRPAQIEAQKRAATMVSQQQSSAVDGVDCPSWHSFKSKEFVSRRASTAGPGRQWRSLKQVVDRENYHCQPAGVTTYTSLRSAPSSHPAKKYCDVTGLPAAYTDPRTRLHYYSAREYKEIKARKTDIIKIMLELRGATPNYTLLLR